MRCWRVAAVVGLSGLLASAGAGSAAGAVPDQVPDASRAADEEIAESGLLIAADFPVGWTESPPETADDGEIEATAKQISSCKRYLALRAMGKKQPRAESSEFELGGSKIDNSVAVFGSTASANAAMRLFEHPSVLPCINRLFSDVLVEELADDPDTRDTITDVAVDIDDADVGGVGDRAHAYEGTVVLTGNDGSDATAGLGIAAVRVGRAVALYSYFVDAEEVVRLLPGLVDASVARLAAAT